MDNKIEIANDYLNNFDELSCYSKTRLFKVLEPFIIGLELTPSPYLGESFKPHFVCYSLAENNLKECLDLPLLLRPVYNKKNIDLNSVPYMLDSAKYKESIDSIRELYGCFLFGDISLKNANIFDKIYSFFDNDIILPMDEAKLHLFKFNIALYLNDKLLIENTLSEIQQRKKNWPPTFYAWKYGSLDGWIHHLEKVVNDREQFLKCIETNKQDKKLKKMIVSKILV